MPYTVEKIRRESELLDDTIHLLSHGVYTRLKNMACEAMAAHPTIGAFDASMGICAFYSRKGNRWIEDSELPQLCREVIMFGDKVTEIFGSPGFEIKSPRRNTKTSK